MSCEDHRRPNDVLPSWNHPDFHSQPQRSRAQLQAGQHLKGRSLPAQSEAALQVSAALHVTQPPAAPWTHSGFCWCPAIRLRATPTPETSGSTCRPCSSTCREKLNSTPRRRTTTSACSSTRSADIQNSPFILFWSVQLGILSSASSFPQTSSQDPARAPLLLSAECQRSGTVTRVSLDYHCCPATAPSTQLTAVQVLLPLDHSATDLQCQPPASWWARWRGFWPRKC